MIATQHYQAKPPNWLPALLVVSALHGAAWWAYTQYQEVTSPPQPLAEVMVKLLPPPEQPRVAPPPPPPPAPAKVQPRSVAQPVAAPPAPLLSSQAADAPVMVSGPDNDAPRQVAVPIAPAAVAAPPAPKAPVEAPLEPPRYNAAYLNNPSPPYPLVARRRGIEGTVLLRAEISTEGEALRVEVKKSSGTEALDQAALEAVRKWRFVPAKRGNRAVVEWVEVPVSFKLDN